MTGMKEIVSDAYDTERTKRMAEIEKVQLIAYEAVPMLWRECASALRVQGVHLGQISADRAERQKQKPTSCEARKGFDRLCERGRVPQVLPAVLILVRDGPELRAAPLPTLRSFNMEILSAH